MRGFDGTKNGEVFFKYKKQFLNQVILAAPDIDADTFREDIAPKIIGSAQRITLYASSNDNALRISRSIHKDKPRAGQAGPNLIKIKGIDTIDATNSNSGWLHAFVLGHSYIKDALLSDVKKLIKYGFPPSQRPPLLKAGDNDQLLHWIWPDQ